MSFDPEKYHVPGEALYEGVIFTEPFNGPSTIKNIPGFKADPRDVMLAAYPKTGITWMTGVLAHTFNDGEVEKTFDKGAMEEQIKFLEFAMPRQPPMLQQIAAAPAPRPYKTHLFPNLLKRQVEDDKCQVIVMLRNPKDTIVSYFHFYRMNKMMGSFDRDFHDFFKLFQADRLVNGNIFQWYKAWWEKRHLDNVHFIRYEDMKKDAAGIIRQVVKICGKDLPDEKIDNIVKATSMKSMKENPKTNFHDAPVFDYKISHFYRKGEVGDWHNYFTEEESKYVDEMCDKYLTPIGLTFTYE